ncbi:acyl-CoA dehydrogenase [Novosphingobium sp. PhB57]|jgi:acyl-CoA dehydrogenase|uniref:acyl-CoA dehydrogenase family protein n=1 Tax=unclassified Novosphingobium TaxID=2644732 RepID=UPI0010455BCC|nr:acyl-CoA dehydrogenase family protein [Novosphingobium sp. PhB57]TCU53660.1 acyl-CoA dehydrogenase [Novosphingobium sp. PhB57]
MDFSTDPEFQEKLDWMNHFVREEVEAMDLLFSRGSEQFNIRNRKARAMAKKLQAQVKAQGLWACHLTPELGGKGYGQVKLALMNEILGRTSWGPVIFGCAAPDTGNAEILAMFGTPEQKARYLQPLLDGEIFSTYAMTEPQAGADPKEFTCHAWREGDEWVIEGEKWYASNFKVSSFVIAMVVTNPENAPHERMSMFLIPSDTPGLVDIRDVAGMNDPVDHGHHAYLRFDQVRVSLDAMLGGPGQGFKLAQARLGGGRIHHAMRVVGQCQRALEMMQERAVSRRTQGRQLGDHQLVKAMIADSALELEMYRLLVLKAAWIIDTQPHGAARTHIAMAKVAMARVYHDIVRRAVHLHGALGTTHETPLARMWMGVPMLSVADGPTEVHQVQIANALLKQTTPAQGLFPSEHIPTRTAEAEARYAAELAEIERELAA